MAEIDWYADGFEVRLEAQPPFAGGAAVLAFLGGVGTVGFGAVAFLTLDSLVVLPMTMCFGIAFASGMLASVLEERRPVRRVAVSAHRLQVREADGDALLDVLLEEVRGIGLVGRELQIRHPGGTFELDVSAQERTSLERVVDALRAAVASRKRPESEEDRARREQALQALQRLRDFA